MVMVSGWRCIWSWILGWVQASTSASSTAPISVKNVNVSDSLRSVSILVLAFWRDGTSYWNLWAESELEFSAIETEESITERFSLREESEKQKQKANNRAKIQRHGTAYLWLWDNCYFDFHPNPTLLPIQLILVDSFSAACSFLCLLLLLRLIADLLATKALMAESTTNDELHSEMKWKWGWMPEPELSPSHQQIGTSSDTLSLSQTIH